ncbi:hypothetical protein M441DRAFT_128625 [Trichoderma asperellum CBS 433.97]|uniref:WKF domain-containing protein n=1 Tax=Trichoderma asperellum (strain ATCC 204424 / CBS 433.97 / NBRC 101777) TaxID=1042311 RepID=A0A2T3ZQG2_TRIA4|nr:hypothetical protein M441DRAFT_128625 [Trichoderma asperellum CBS 433.97]PTB47048.1 hypothetical protein M441DRAFT_128625 [Trichoderma asperellum CBS 433.97]
MISSGDGATARAPAWKRLGLKLKQSSEPEPANETLQVGHPSSSRTQQTPSKRKPEAPPAGEPLSALKKKSVSFGETPTKSGIDSKGPVNKPAPKKAKTPGKKKANAAVPPSDIKPALEYLNQWKSARDSWKFNKNYQTILIKHAFDPVLFPSANVDTFYLYIRDLKGFVRTRLQETAMEIRTKDSTEGAAGFPEGSVNLPEKQLRYDQLLAQLLHSQAGQKRKTFHEVEYRTSSEDVDDVIRRVIKRMRAELVLDQLSEGEESDASHTTTATVSSGVSVAESNTTKATEGDSQVKLKEGPSKRKRKLRTNVDDSSSSESESDSDDSSSSSSDDSDSDSDSDDGKEADKGNESSSSESSSSSSSSSSSEDESDSDDESSDEE